MLVLAISENLDKLLEDGGLAAVAALSKFCGIMKVAVDAAVVLVVAVLSTENGGTDGAGEMFDVVFTVEGCYVRTAEGTAAGEAKEIETAEVVSLAQRVLIGPLLGHREELGGYNLVAILQRGMSAPRRNRQVQGCN